MPESSEHWFDEPGSDEHRLDGMMAALRHRASTVHGSFDAGVLAAAGRRRARRRRAALGGALVGVVVMVLGGGFWGLATWVDRPLSTADSTSTSSPAAPTTEPVGPTAEPTGPTAPPTGEVAPVQVTVDTSGWATFVSPEYPVTFRYPPGWTVGDDGCSTINCVAIAWPPTSSGQAPVELLRNGFEDCYSVPLSTVSPQVLGSLPGLTGWSLDGRGPAPVVVLKDGADLTLAVAGSQTSALALGDHDPVPGHTETAFSFATNVGNVGGQTGGENTATLVAILASVQPNPGFAPTQYRPGGWGCAQG